ncbi:hypothetical protein HZC21_00655 [Candidatus Peregrinibacteria bacterium]|nr:hypothetical protein [Candidatus Peregrinibacteria bacterium]
MSNRPDSAKFSQPPGMQAPEHISMNNFGYAFHVLGNAMSMITACISYPTYPEAQQDLIEAKQETIRRINFLLEQYKEDLKNMPEFRDFLELLLDAVQNDKFENAVKLYRLGVKAFQPEALSRPGRHLSQEMEAVESEPSLRLTVADHCENPAGLYIGLSRIQRKRLAVEVGGTVELFDDKNKSLGVFTVGKSSEEYVGMDDLFTANQVREGEIVTVKKYAPPPDKPQEFKLPVTHGVENTVDPAKHRARTDKIAERFREKLDPEMYITLPTSIAFQLGIKPEPGKTTAPISKCAVRDASGREIEIAIVPTGTTIGFTTSAAQELDIPKELTEIKIIIDKGVLVIA